MPRLFAIALLFYGLAVASCTVNEPRPLTPEGGDLQEGVTAYEHGKYGTALKKLKPLAERGDGYAQYIIATMYYLGQEVPHDWSEAHKWYSLAAASLPAGRAREEATEYRDLTSKLVKIRQSAEQGDSAAQALVAGFYASGKGAPRDYTEAAKWFRRSADQGFPEAQYRLGTMYHHGLGVPEDSAQVLKWYLRAAQNGHSETIKLLRSMATEGDSTLQSILGGIYLEKKDYENAVHWLRKASEQGFPPAQFALGEMYYFGLGVEQNDFEAARWFRKSAEQGDADAQYSLGTMHSSGRGVPQDGEEAFRWYLEAAWQGHSKSIEMFREHAEEGSPNAQWLLGNMYRQGKGLPKDLAAAAKWHRRAAEQGFAVAQFDLGGMYAAGEGVPQDDAEAVRWWQLAAKQGLPKAYFNLGNNYATGRGVTQDYVRAHMYLNLAAAEGIPGAAKNRDLLAKYMTSDQVAEAQKLAREWRESLR